MDILKAEKVPVTSLGKLLVKDRANCAELVNKDGPVANDQEGEPGCVGIVGFKRGSSS